ncbi:30S ribosomal protein S20 [candidate division TM6 bacterium RIFCSPHIGHO2_12_FULL_38_8]|nr:MAG: 30S ribosomal protein S20 [candidate division TM6 bacterium RIFCSPHIGHO2_12_FULL_38_8]
MANIKSAKKQAIQAKKRETINTARKSSVKTAMKKVIDALVAGKPAAEVQVLFNDAQSQCARAKGKNVFHPKTTARKVSRLALKIQKHFAPATATK